MGKLASEEATWRGRGAAANAKTVVVANTNAPNAPPVGAPSQLINGRYRVLEQIGEGAACAVYRVIDEELGETIALKRLGGDLVRGTRGFKIFRDEVRVARGITHKNVARVFDFGMDVDCPFITMELVEGESLRRRIRNQVGGRCHAPPPRPRGRAGRDVVQARHRPRADLHDRARSRTIAHDRARSRTKHWGASSSRLAPSNRARAR